MLKFFAKLVVLIQFSFFTVRKRIFLRECGIKVVRFILFLLHGFFTLQAGALVKKLL